MGVRGVRGVRVKMIDLHPKVADFQTQDQWTNSCEVGDLHQLRGKAVPVKKVWEDETTGAGAIGEQGNGF